MGLGHGADDWGILGVSVASAGSLMGRIWVQGTLGLWPTHWLEKLGPGDSASPLVARASSWDMVSWPRGLRVDVRSVVGGAGS